ncbi:GNAT family N-acetyltransferase [Nonomuraea sp. M3C6]|uniref:GNAT family N-acetyltransferase n=1 Tax=Nonomuraea marmarensis TaxID=3351344 RepID=A0ABW7AK19_9ACTN
MSEKALINGWSDAAGVRIRQARAGDLPAMAELVPLAGVRIEDVLREAVTADIAGAALRSGLRGGAGAFHRHLAEQFARHFDDPLQAYLHAALVLVAEHRDRGIVGTLIAYPPLNVADDHLQVIPARADPTEAQRRVVMLGAIGLAKIKAVAVAETERRRGIGAALLKRCQQIYVHCGDLLLYGAMPPTPGLSAFYRCQGFDVMEARAPMDMWMVFGVHSSILPGADERFFFRRFQPGSVHRGG